MLSRHHHPSANGAWNCQGRLLALVCYCCLFVAYEQALRPALVQADNLKQEDQVIHVKIGALLEKGSEEQAGMFARTIKMINEEREKAARHWDANGGRPPQPDRASAVGDARLVGRQHQKMRHGRPVFNSRLKLEPMIESLALDSAHSTYEADIRVCQLIESGAHAIMGPGTHEASIQHVQSICDNMKIPYFELRPLPSSSPASSSVASERSIEVAHKRPEDDKAKGWTQSREQLNAYASSRLEADLSLNLYPPAHLLTSAYIDLIYAWNWTSFAIVYEDNHSMIKLQDLFRESSGTWTSKWQIRLFQFDPTSPTTASLNNPSSSRISEKSVDSSSKNNRAASFRDLFWLIRQTGERNILLDVPAQHLSSALKQAQQVGCMTEQYSFLITSLDLKNIDLEDFKYSRVKLSGFSLVQLPQDTSNSNKSNNNNKFPPLASRDKLTAIDHDYLKRLGLQVSSSPQLDISAGNEASHYKSELDAPAMNVNRYKLSPSIELERARDYLEPTQESIAHDHLNLNSHKQSSSPQQFGGGGWYRHGNPAADRLVEFLVEQQLKPLTSIRLPLTSAIIHDSLILYSLALDKMNPETSNFLVSRRVANYSSLTCTPPNVLPWLSGSSIVNYMRHTTFEGLTGLVSFDDWGLRSGFKLDLLGMAPDVGLIKVGEWNSSKYDATSRLAPQPYAEDDLSNEERSVFYGNLLRDYRNMVKEGSFSLNYTSVVGRSGALQVNQYIYERLYREQVNNVDTLIVTSKLSNPYFMLKETPNKLNGNDQYEGFAVDLIHELSRLINFKYRWREVPDKKYGVKEVLSNGSVSWNGIIGEIVRGHADLAVLDLTITAQREEAVDFTLPFMNTGISILFKKPTTKVTTLFSFLSPFSADVWAYVLAAYCSISTILYMVGHLSPYEWADPRPCRHTSTDSELLLRNQFSLLNSFWFTIGSLMQQGSDLTPRSMSTRTVAGIWYFFTLIMISSYTANLAAFLTVEKVVYPIESARDLSDQQEIKYGCVESGSTCTFFKDSQIDTYKRIHENMLKHKTYVKSNEHGQKRVEEGKFAFFMESTSIEYIVERNCNLTQIGGLLDSKGYGMATSKRSRFRRPYRTLLSEGILHLQETGVLHMLKNRWWKERRGGGTCTDDSKGSGVTELSLANVGGVFVVLLGGLGISFLVAIVEFMWRSQREGCNRDRMCDQMMRDFGFALSCKYSVKPVSQDRQYRLRRERSQRHEQLTSNYQLRKKVWPHSNLQSSSSSSKNISVEEMLLINGRQQQQHQGYLNQHPYRHQHQHQLQQYPTETHSLKSSEQAQRQLLQQQAKHQSWTPRKVATNKLAIVDTCAQAISHSAHRHAKHQQPIISKRQFTASNSSDQVQDHSVQEHRLEARRRLCLLSRQTINAEALVHHLEAS